MGHHNADVVLDGRSIGRCLDGDKAFRVSPREKRLRLLLVERHAWRQRVAEAGRQVPIAHVERDIGRKLGAAVDRHFDFL